MLTGQTSIVELPKGWKFLSSQPNIPKPEINMYFEVDDQAEKETVFFAVFKTGSDIPTDAVYCESAAVFHIFQVKNQILNKVFNDEDHLTHGSWKQN